MNIVDRYLLRNGFNLDGSKMKKKEAKKENKKNLKTEFLLSSKNDQPRLRFKKEAMEDRIR
jgi:hypothetical protein